MQTFPPTIIIRHRKENLKKCSLRGLESREDLLFFRYPTDPLPPVEGYMMLALDAPPLTRKDDAHGLLLIDGTWRNAGKMTAWVEGRVTLIKRSLPAKCRTAYPRRQEDCPDPERGLASVEALYLAYSILERNTEGLLDHYHWRDEFLSMNRP